MDEDAPTLLTGVQRLIPLMLAALGVLVYAGSFGAPFIFDDTVAITGNPEVRRLAFRFAARCITDFTFKLNYALSGMNAAEFRAVNVAIHVAAGLLLYGVLRRTLRLPRWRPEVRGSAAWLAGAAAAIWLVHPLQTESVTYLCQRYESLAGLAALACLYGFVRAREARHPRAWLDASLAVCAVGMGTKETMVAAPFAVLLYDYAFVGTGVRDIVRQRGRYYIAMFATIGMLAMLVLRTMGGLVTRGDSVAGSMTAWAFLRSQPEVIAHYLRLTLYPAGLCLDYAWPVATGWRATLVPGVALVAVLAAGLYGLWRRRAWGFLTTAFFLFLAPSSSILPLPDLAFEHRMYLALAPLAVAAVLAAHGLLRRAAEAAGARGGLAWPAGALAVAVIAALGWTTTQRNRAYASAETMWREVIAVAPDNYRQRAALVTALMEAGRAKEAEAEARALIDRAAEALKRGPRSTFVPARNAATYLPAGWIQLGRAQLLEGRMDEAAASFREALAHEGPQVATARYNLAVALLMQGELAGALREADAATQLDRNYVNAYALRGMILARLGRFEEAVRAYGDAVAYRPPMVSAELNLAWLLASCRDPHIRDGRQAAALAEAVLKQSGGQSWRAMSAMAAAEAEQGRWDDAVRDGGQALALARAWFTGLGRTEARGEGSPPSDAEYEAGGTGTNDVAAYLEGYRAHRKVAN